MKTAIVVIACLAILLAIGCRSGDVKITPVIAGQQAPHEGYNIGSELYLETGSEVLVTGAIIWIKGLDPNDLWAD